MFWKAGLKITPVYKDGGGSPLSLTRTQAGWTPGGAGGLRPKTGQILVPGPLGLGKNSSQIQSPEAALLPELRQSQGHRGCSCFKSLFSSRICKLKQRGTPVEL